MNQTVRRQLPSEDTVRSLYCILTSLILLIVFQTTAVASVFLPVGLNAGDTYQLVFLSQGETAATSSSISYYTICAEPSRIEQPHRIRRWRYLQCHR